MLRSIASGMPKKSAITERSMTISAGANGLILSGSPPICAIASRIAARSTTHGTPVKSCMRTRAGVNWISVLGWAAGSHAASARTWSAVMLAPSSVRSRFSSKTLRLNGSRSAPGTACRRKIEYVESSTARRPSAPKLLTLIVVLSDTRPCPRRSPARHHEAAPGTGTARRAPHTRTGSLEGLLARSVHRRLAGLENDAHLAVRLHLRALDRADVGDAPLAQLGKQLLLGHQLSAHVAPEHAPVADQHEGLGLDDAAKPRVAVGQRVDGHRPEHQGGDEQEPLRHRAVVAGHRVLRRVREQHEHEQVGHRGGAGLPFEREAQQQEDRQVGDRAPNHDLHRVGVESHDRRPVDGHVGGLPARVLSPTVFAMTLPTFGGPEVLTWAEVADPKPRAGEVLLDVVATSVNRADIMQRRGFYPPPPGESDVPGLECTGRIAALGDGVDGWAVGDEACALLAGGGYAQRVAVPAGQLLPVPLGLDLVTSAALPEVTCTVWSNVFELAGLRPGEAFLVHGGASGVGTMAIHLARAHGARVFCTAGTPEKLTRCRELGAAVAINYRDEDFVARVREETGGRGVDVILDNMGATYLARNVAALAPDGRTVTIGLQGGRRAELDLGLLLAKRGAVHATSLRGRPAAQKAAIVRAVREHVWPLVERGEVHPVVDRVLPLREAAEAHRLVEASGHVGKVLLTV